MEKDELDFKGRLKYEHFQFFFRKHWVKFLQPVFFTIPLFLLILFILLIWGRLILLVDLFFIRAVYVHFVVVITAMLMLFFTLQIINFYFDMVVVTDVRIIIVRKTVFLKNNSDVIDLTKVQDIGVESHGLLRNYLRYGKLIITLSTAAPPITIHHVPDPHYYLEWCNRVKREHIIRRRTDRSAKDKEQSDVGYLKDIKNLTL